MSDLPKRQHPLAAFFNDLPADGHDNPGAQVEILPYLGYLNLRGDPTDERFLKGVEAALGQALPIVANTNDRSEQTIYTLSPDEWLLVTQSDKEKKITAQLHQALAKIFFSVSDLTGGQMLFRLSGTYAKEILAKGCTLDFHSSAFKVGQCAQTALAKAAILIALVDDKPTFDIIVRRSFVEYVALWLQQAGREYAVQFK